MYMNSFLLTISKRKLLNGFWFDCVCTNSQYSAVSLLPHSLGMRLGYSTNTSHIRICQLHALLPPLVAWQVFYKDFAGKSSSLNWTSQSGNTATDAMQYYSDVL